VDENVTISPPANNQGMDIDRNAEAIHKRVSPEWKRYSFFEVPRIVTARCIDGVAVPQIHRTIATGTASLWSVLEEGSVGAPGANTVYLDLINVPISLGATRPVVVC